VRPVIAGGVPSLLLAPRPDLVPTILHLHGGGYVMGSAFGYRHLASALAAAADACVIVSDYRLAPEHPFPAALEDALRAYVWMLDAGVPPDEIVVADDSAGGGLALSLLTTLARQDLPLGGGSMHFCPGIDLSYPEESSSRANPNPPSASRSCGRSPPPISARPRPTTRWSTRCAPTSRGTRRC
jgi:acetyl esterase/lipase